MAHPLAKFWMRFQDGLSACRVWFGARIVPHKVIATGYYNGRHDCASTSHKRFFFSKSCQTQNRTVNPTLIPGTYATDAHSSRPLYTLFATDPRCVLVARDGKLGTQQSRTNTVAKRPRLVFAHTTQHRAHGMHRLRALARSVCGVHTNQGYHHTRSTDDSVVRCVHSA